MFSLTYYHFLNGIKKSYDHCSRSFVISKTGFYDLRLLNMRAAKPRIEKVVGSGTTL